MTILLFWFSLLFTGLFLWLALEGDRKSVV